MEKKEDESPQIIGVVLLLLDYFGEKDKVVFAIGKVSTKVVKPSYLSIFCQ